MYCSELCARRSFLMFSQILWCKNICFVYQMCKKMIRKNQSLILWQMVGPQLYRKWLRPYACMSGIDEFGCTDRTLTFLCYRQRCATNDVKAYAQRGTVLARRSSGRTKFCKSTINLTERHFTCFVSENLRCDESCVLRRRGSFLYRATPIDTNLFPKRTLLL